MVDRNGIKRTSIRRSNINAIQKNNFHAAKIIGNMIRTSFGPKGLDKMTINSLGDIFIVNDGKTILEKVDYKHPIAKTLLDITKTVTSSIGDGSISAVLLATSLIDRASELMERGIHPNVIAKGYAMSLSKSLDILKEQGMAFHPSDKECLKRIVKTSLTPKIPLDEFDVLSDLIIRAVTMVSESDDSELKWMPTEYVKVVAREWLPLSESKLIDGIAFDASVFDSGMPKIIKGARIAIVQSLIGIRETKFRPEINIADPQYIGSFKTSERAIIMAMIKQVIASGVNVLFTHKGIDDSTKGLLTASGILTVRRVPLKDIEKIERSTGAKMVLSPDDLTQKSLGYADCVKEVDMSEKKWIVVDGGKMHRAATILVGDVIQRSADNIEDVLNRTIHLLRQSVKEPITVAGGGACEMEISHRLRSWASSVHGRKQLAVDNYSKALESIPLSLAINSGMNPLDTISELRNRHTTGGRYLGIDTRNLKISDMRRKGVIEPMKLKEQILESATDAAISIIMVSDVYRRSKIRSNWSPPKEPE